VVRFAHFYHKLASLLWAGKQGVIEHIDLRWNMENLLISVLGNRNSGKSFTWNTMFGKTVKSGTKIRKLFFNKCEYVEVYLVSGSPEERNKYVGELIGSAKPRIVLCSVQYKEEARETYRYFIGQGFFLFIHWLNPGYGDPDTPYYDSLGFENWLLAYTSLLGIRSGKVGAAPRVQEMKDFIYGWAKSRNLIVNDCVNAQ